MKTYLLTDEIQIIGRAGEQGGITIAVDVSAWQSEYQDGVGGILVTRPGKVREPLVTTISGGLMLAELPPECTDRPGSYEYTATWTLAGTIEASQTYRTIILSSEIERGVPQDGWHHRTPDWAKEIYIKAEQILNSVDAALQMEQFATDAEAARDEAVAAESACSEVLDIVNTSEEIIADIQQAVTDAQTAADGIEEQKDTMIASIAAIAEMGTDPTLTQTGVAADAKASGDQIVGVKDALSVNSLNYTEHIKPRAIKDDGTWVSGTTTYAHMIFNVSAGDEISVTANSGYYTSIACLRSYNISPSGGDEVDFSEDENWDAQVKVNAGTTFNGIVPDDALYFYILLQTSPSYVRMPTSIKINGYEYLMTLQKNLETLLPVVSYPQKIRIMQYNCGMWSMGNHESMTSENFPVKMDNYKKFLCKYKADVVGIQEWVEELTIGGETKNINTLLFNPIYPYKNDYIYTGSVKGRALKSKWVLTDIVKGSINGDLFDSSSNCLYCLSHINYYGRSVALLTTAIVPTSQSAANVTSRSELMPLLFNLIKNEEYAFLICDVNNVGDGANISITDEGDSINEIAEQNGFTGAMGSYYPWTDTYKSYATPHKYGAIDNIFYRNNGKTLFVDYTIPMDEYDNLFSDHIPCIGDFILL